VIRRRDEDDDKLVIVPEGAQYTDDQILVAGAPIREIIADGTDDDHGYTISTKSVGQEVDSLSPDGFRTVLPSVSKILSALSSTDITDTDGYGWLNEYGNGTFPTWRSHSAKCEKKNPVCSMAVGIRFSNRRFLRKTLRSILGKYQMGFPVGKRLYHEHTGDV